MSEALKHNTTLQSFTMESRCTSYSDKSGVSMAEALGHNWALQSFTMNASETSFGDMSGVAMAEALRRWCPWHRRRRALAGHALGFATV